MGRLLVILAILCPYLCCAQDTSYRDAIRDRIRPIGEVKLEPLGKEAQAALEAANAKKPVSVGEDIYNRYCHVCHSAGVAGAPKMHNAADWKPRKEAKGVAGLVKSAIKGLNAMPAKGTCMECGAKEIEAALKFMLPK